MCGTSLSNEEAAKIIFEKFKERLMEGKVVDIGIYAEGVQPYLMMMTIEKDGRRTHLTFKEAPKIDGAY